MKEAILYGHEVGHHVCGHLTGKQNRTMKEQELEADRFAGAAIRAHIDRGYYFDYPDTKAKMLSDVEVVLRAVGADREGDSHPTLKDRLAAFAAGWDFGSNCKP